METFKDFCLAQVEISELITRYFVAQAAVNASVAIVIGTALLVLGVKYALLWIFTIGLLRFIPYLGIWIAATLAFAVSVATTSTWSQPVATIAVFMVFEPLVGMILEPIVFGKTIGVSKSGMLLSITFWAWLWGPLGMLLATPLPLPW
jgi:predicted PurR-regulated permease PerM